MSDSSAEADPHAERCNACGRETPHTVSIEFRVESRKRENAEFSREPYRVAECRRCGERRVRRMNDA